MGSPGSAKTAKNQEKSKPKNKRKIRHEKNTEKIEKKKKRVSARHYAEAPGRIIGGGKKADSGGNLKIAKMKPKNEAKS